MDKKGGEKKEMKKILIIISLIACLGLAFAGSAYCAVDAGGASGGGSSSRGDYHFRHA